jgi:bacteriochlorophyllide a dehydrogenase
MDTVAVVLEAPERLELRKVPLAAMGESDITVAVSWSGISTGTERLLWSGRMPAFPGMGYPLVPGYEAVGTVVDAGASSGFKTGECVFVPGAQCFDGVRGLFGGAASRLVVPAARAVRLDPDLGSEGVLFALAATAAHALAEPHAKPDLIIGHGVLGRLLARLTIALGGPPPVVWETNSARRSGHESYLVIDPSEDTRRDYRAIYDASGDASLIDALIQRLAPGGEVVLAGFYEQPISFAFPPAFMREARLRIAAQWQPADLALVSRLVTSGALSLGGLITHLRPAAEAADAYPAAFNNPDCLKMVLDWRISA